MEGLSFFGAFERHVLPEMGDALVIGTLVSTAYIEHDATMNNLGGGNLVVNHPDSIG
jgi:hypothetical protein